MRSNRRRKSTIHSLEDLEPRLLLATFRSIDGSGNNLRPGRSDQGAADTNLIRFGYPAVYPDGFGDEIFVSPQRPNPRDISNAVVAQSESIPNDRNLSDWIVQWGQFVTHDMDLTGTDAANNQLSTGATGDFGIPITDGTDPLGPNPIGFNRSNFDPTTGDNTQVGQPPPRPNWREQINEITSYIDASQVYGSDDTRAGNLRTFIDGKLKTSASGLLPELNDAGEENDNPLGLPATSLFLAGDVRANEQIGLTATHALFVREHNRLADLIKVQNPSFTDEDIYQWARKIVGAQMQIITYEEFLPALMGAAAPNPAAYSYSNTVDASITNSFAAAFFRYGHSMQSSTLKLVGDDGHVVDDLSLRDIFFNAAALVDNPGIVDVALKGLASQTAQENDIKLVDDVRNFLFGPPGAGGTDLAALDIQRGRDHGLQDFNASRQAYGLTRIMNFSQLTSDTQLSADLQSLYGNINNLDAWVGAIAEDHDAGSSIGSMLRASFTDQFTRLRDGDRFFYTGDPDLNDAVVTGVIDLNDLTLASIIRANTTITNIQDNVFFSAPAFHVAVSDAAEVTEGGSTETASVVLLSAPASNVVIDIASDTPLEATVSKSTMTFTPGNWHVAQSVTITGVDDDIVDGDQTSVITYSVDGSLSDDSFDQLPNFTVNVTTTDDDVAGISVTPTATIVDESGTSDSFLVVLEAEPLTNVVLDVANPSTDEVTADAASLTFTPTNWNVAQTINVTGVDDFVVDGDQVTPLTISVDGNNSDDAFDNAADSAVNVTTTDDDTRGVTVSALSGDTTEAGGAATFTVALDTMPTADVTIAVSSDNTAEGTVSPMSLTFTPANWNSAQTVTVTGVDDAVADGSVTYNIVLDAAVGGDYDSIDPPDLVAVNQDDESLLLDVDGNSVADAATDGIIIIRYLFDFRGDSLVTGAIGANATNTTASAIETLLGNSLVMLDVDGNGVRDAATDGILIIRYLFDFRGDVLVNNAIGAGAIRTTGPQVEEFLDGFMPQSSSIATSSATSSSAATGSPASSGLSSSATSGAIRSNDPPDRTSKHQGTDGLFETGHSQLPPLGELESEAVVEVFETETDWLSLLNL